MAANVHHPQYSYVFNFEKDFDHSSVKGWLEENWISLCSWSTAIYVAFIFGVQAYMKDKEPFNLRRPLALWSACLAVFSIAGALRTWTEFLDTYSRGGVYLSLCTPSFITEDRVAGLWTYLFVMSKVMELFDTAFIVLRKQKLIFLHWYHHITVMWMSFFSYIDVSSSCRLFMVMNFSVHSMMYTYYTLRAMRIQVPKMFAMMTTSLQIIQMVFGLLITLTVIQYKQNGLGCSVSDEQNKISFFIYTSYFILFARFFYNAYLAPKTPMIDKESKKKEN